MKRIVCVALFSLLAVLVAQPAEVATLSFTLNDDSTRAYVAVLDEHAADIELPHHPWGPAVEARRSMRRVELEDHYGFPVTLLTVVVANETASRDTLHFPGGIDLGLVREGQRLPSLGFSDTLLVAPGDMVVTFVVYPLMDALPSDSLYAETKNP